MRELSRVFVFRGWVCERVECVCECVGAEEEEEEEVSVCVSE